MTANDTITDIVEQNLEDDLILLSDISMSLEESRLKTFKNWPFPATAKCNAEMMAQAGFVHTPTNDCPDSARCFFCCKELDGWEISDDPWKEHVSHARGKCQFLPHAKHYETELTKKKFVELEMQRMKNIAQMLTERKKQRIKDQANEVVKKMAVLV